MWALTPGASAPRYPHSHTFNFALRGIFCRDHPAADLVTETILLSQIISVSLLKLLKEMVIGIGHPVL